MSDGNLKFVDIESLKKWALANLPVSSRLREILLLEKDKLSIEGFLAKMDVWLKLIRLEGYQED